MAWREATEPVRMQRVALVAPTDRLRDLLARVADAGTVELDRPAGANGAGTQPGPATGAGAEARLAPAAPDLAALEQSGRTDLLAGEAELAAHARDAVAREAVSGLAGWMPAAEVPRLAARLAEVGAAVVPIATPRGTDPPTLLRSGRQVRQAVTPLVETYGTVPYADVDPSVLAGVTYVLMFGMMFGDVGHGAMLVAAGMLLRTGRVRRLAGLRRLWPFVVGAGAAGMFFGLLYGECFGPTGLVPVVWLAPLEEPLTLLAVALGVGAVLLAGAQTLGTVNRWREGGWPLAVSSPSGVAGAALLAGLGLVVLGSVTALGWLVVPGAAVMAAGVVLAFLGFLAAAGGGAAAVTQAVVEVFDALMRLLTNLVSFARLAAFGLTHAAIGAVVWDGTTALWQAGGLLLLAAVAVFVVGNALAFGLEALVAGVQALRLEYYELFSRVFAGEGRPFRPWHVPLDTPRSRP